MKNFKTLLTFVAVTLVASLAFADQPAATNTDPFTITLPAGFGAFARQTQNVKSPQGDIETTNWVSKAPTGEAVVITLSKMPGKILDPEKMISTTRDSLVKTLNATVESSDAAGTLFRSDKAVFRSHYIVDNDRLFQLLYVGRTPDQRNAPAVGQMFDSFKLAAAAPAATAAPAAPAVPAAAPAPAAPAAAPATTTKS